MCNRVTIGFDVRPTDDLAAIVDGRSTAVVQADIAVVQRAKVSERVRLRDRKGRHKQDCARRQDESLHNAHTLKKPLNAPCPAAGVSLSRNSGFLKDESFAY
jgi:hypothetical protein